MLGRGHRSLNEIPPAPVRSLLTAGCLPPQPHQGVSARVQFSPDTPETARHIADATGWIRACPGSWTARAQPRPNGPHKTPRTPYPCAAARLSDCGCPSTIQWHPERSVRIELIETGTAVTRWPQQAVIRPATPTSPAANHPRQPRHTRHPKCRR